jgi:hypothetical protein
LGGIGFGVPVKIIGGRRVELDVFEEDHAILIGDGGPGDSGRPMLPPAGERGTVSIQLLIGT